MKTIFAHRGMSTLAPENTLAAFMLCVSHGIKWIECDINILGDDTVVVAHDDTLDRCTDHAGCLSLITADDLPLIDAGSWFDQKYRNERMPTLDSLLKLVNDCKLNVNIEIKPSSSGWKKTLIMIDKVIAGISHLGNGCQAIVSSSNPLVLYELKKRYPKAAVACLFSSEQFDSDWRLILEACEAEYAHLEDKALTRETVNQIKEKKVKVNVYTVNSRKRADELFHWGVDGVFTDIAHEFSGVN